MRAQRNAHAGVWEGGEQLMVQVPDHSIRKLVPAFPRRRTDLTGTNDVVYSAGEFKRDVHHYAPNVTGNLSGTRVLEEGRGFSLCDDGLLFVPGF